MRKFLRSKLFISIILLLVAFAFSFILLPKLFGNQNETIKVIQVTSDVSAGTKFTEDMVKTTTIGKYGTDASVITNPDTIIGKYAAKDISTRQYIYPDMISDTFEAVEGSADLLIGPGQKLITISLDSAAVSVGGIAEPGDKVNILSQVIEEYDFDINGNVIYDTFIEMEDNTVLKGVTLYKLQNSELQDITELKRKWKAAEASGDSRDFDDSLIPAYATVIVNDEQALILAQEEYEGTVHMVLYPDNYVEYYPASSEIDKNGTSASMRFEKETYKITLPAGYSFCYDVHGDSTSAAGKTINGDSVTLLIAPAGTTEITASIEVTPAVIYEEALVKGAAIKVLSGAEAEKKTVRFSEDSFGKSLTITEKLGNSISDSAEESEKPPVSVSRYIHPIEAEDCIVISFASATNEAECTALCDAISIARSIEAASADDK